MQNRANNGLWQCADAWAAPGQKGGEFHNRSIISLCISFESATLCEFLKFGTPDWRSYSIQKKYHLLHTPLVSLILIQRKSFWALTLTVNTCLHLVHINSFWYSSILAAVVRTTVPDTHKSRPTSQVRGTAWRYSSGQVGSPRRLISNLRPCQHNIHIADNSEISMSFKILILLKGIIVD